MDHRHFLKEQLNRFLRYINADIRLIEKLPEKSEIEKDNENLKKKLASERRKWFSITLVFAVLIILWFFGFHFDEYNSWIYALLSGVKAIVFIAILIAFVNICKIYRE